MCLTSIAWPELSDQVQSVGFLTMCFSLHICIFFFSAFYNLYLDHLDLITKFWPGSTKWNTPFSPLVRQLEKLVFHRRVFYWGLKLFFAIFLFSRLGNNLEWHFQICSTTSFNLPKWEPNLLPPEPWCAMLPEL